MLKKTLHCLKNIVVFTTTYAFLAASLPTPAQAYLPPLSNAQLYTLASQGNVRALRMAIQRGLNIDSLDSRGNTALCHSVIQRNYTAYNTLRAAGANPHHPCMQNLQAQGRDSFLESRRVAPVTATSRQAYSYIGDEEFSLSNLTLIAGGALALGAALAIVFSSGGGGGGDNVLSYNTTEYTLAGIVGTKRPDYPADYPYNPIILLEQTGGTITNGDYPDYDLGVGSIDGWVVSNDANINIDDTSTPLTDVIDFRTSVLDYGNYIQAAMKAINEGSTVNNGYEPGGDNYQPSDTYLITVKDNAAALSAYKNAFANNYSNINIDAKNGALGMVASLNSQAVNQLLGNINMNFNGTADNHGIIGMYADTGASITNDGTIYGRAQSSDSTKGTMIGMRGQLLNQEKAPFSKTNVTNNGSITLDLSATNKEVNTSMIGMGSWLEDSFLNGGMYLSRAGFISLINQGTITLNATLSGSGSYSPSSENSSNMLLDGVGGIVGMRSDGNTTAVNVADINININDAGSNTVSGAAAAMQSVHGGSISNQKNITLTGGSGNYGMLSVRGDGSNSEFDSITPNLQNSGTISIDGENSYGMASYNGGSSNNSGTISMAQVGTGIMHNTGIIYNNGSVSLQKGGVGLSMTQQGDIYNTNSGSIVIDNAQSATSTSSDNSATQENGGDTNTEDTTTEDTGTSSTQTTTTTDDASNASIAISSQKGNVYNNGSILMTNKTNASNTTSYGIKGNEVTAENTGSITINDANDSYGVSITNGEIINSGLINLGNTTGTANNSAYGLQISQGNVTNSGQISLRNKLNAYGIQAGSGNVVNTAEISIENSTATSDSVAYAISAGSGSVSNTADLTVFNATDAYGISSGNGNVTNSGVIDISDSALMEGNAGYAIQTQKGNITNNAAINIANKDNAYGLSTENGSIDSNAAITINGNSGALSSIAYAINGGTGYINSNAEIVINNANEGYGISSSNGNITNNAAITLTNTQQSQNKTSYGIKSELGNVINNADINMNVTGDLSAGIDTDTGSFGIWTNQSNITNNENATITFTKRGNGLYSTSGYINNYGDIDMQAGGVGIGTSSGNATNFKNATITIDDTGIGMQSGLGQAFNQGDINITGSLSTGMESQFYAENTGNINISGYNSKGMAVTASNAQIINKNVITITTSENGLYNYGMYGSDGVLSRITNDGTITFSGRGYPTTENVGYGIYFSNGQAVNNGDIIVNDMYGYGMYFTNGGTLNNAANITLNYGGIGMGGNGTGSSDSQETAAMINQKTGVITINGQDSYGMKGEGVTTSWNDGIINITGSNSYGIYSTNGSGTNNNTITVDSDDSVGMYSESADIINKNGATITMNGNNAIGMETASGGTTSTSTQGAVNQGTITLNGTNSVGMQTSGEGKVSNKNTINVAGSQSSGMTADGSGSVSNDGTINVTASSSYGMSATDGTATNNGEINVDADDAYALYANGDAATIVNGQNGNINLGESNNSKYAMYVENGTALNEGNLAIAKDGAIGVFVQAGSGENQNIINMTGNNAFAMQSIGGGTITNSVGKVGNVTYEELATYQPTKGIFVNGENSYGMQAGGQSTANNTSTGVIVVNGANSYGMATTGTTIGSKTYYGTANNDGIIIVQNADSQAMYADGGIIQNTENGMIYTNGQYGMYVHAGQGNNTGLIQNINGGSADTPFVAMHSDAGSLTNEGRIKLDGDYSIGMEATGNSSATNSNKESKIEVNGENSIGMSASGAMSTATNNGKISVAQSNSYAMQADNGGTITNAGTISSEGDVLMNVLNGSGINEGDMEITDNAIGIDVVSGSGRNTGNMNIKGMNATGIQVTTGSGSNSRTMSVSGTSASGMNANNGGATVTNSSDGTISVTGSQAAGLKTNGGTAINEGAISVSSTDGYAMYADNGGTIKNTSKATIQTAGSSAMYANVGNIINEADLTSSNNNFKALYVAQSGNVNNSGDIDLTGTSSSAIYVAGGANANVTNSGDLKLSGSGSIGIYVAKGTVTNSGNISMSGQNSSGLVGIQVDSGAINNTGDILVDSSSAIGIMANGGAITTSNADIDVSGSNAVGISVGNAANLTVDNNETSGNTIEVSGMNAVGLKATDGSSISITSSDEDNIYSINVSGDGAVGLMATNGSKIELKSGILNVSGGNNVGVSVSGTGSSATNYGTINVSDDSGIGMLAENGASATNENYIFISGSNVVGMRAESGGTITNKGTIVWESASYDASTDVSGKIMQSSGGTITNYGQIINIADFPGDVPSVSAQSDNTPVTYSMASSDAAPMFMMAAAPVSASDENAHEVDNTDTETSADLADSTVAQAPAPSNAAPMLMMAAAPVSASDENVADEDVIENTLAASVETENSIDEDSSYSKTSDSASSSDTSSRILMGEGSNITAKKISGNFGIAGEATLDGNKNSYTLSNVLTSADISEANISGTAWFNKVDVTESKDEVDLSSVDKAIEQINNSLKQQAEANGEEVDESKLLTNKLSANDLKNYDVTVTKGDLSEILAQDDTIQDRTLLDKLDSAYEAQKDSQIFDPMKMAQTNEELSGAIADELGLKLFGSFTKQNLDVIKSANRQINSALFNDKQDKDVRILTGYDYHYHDRDASADMQGYEDQAHSVFALADKKLGDDWRAGIGVLLTKYSSEYDNNRANRSEVIGQVLAPLTYQPNQDTMLVSIPRLGIGKGEYHRQSISGYYDGDITNYYYGITNEARQMYDIGWLGLEPTLELNILGMHQNALKENSALRVDAQDALSIEGGVGLYATKLFEFGEKQKFKIRAGGTYYHEFGDPYKARRARLTDADVDYYLNKYNLSRNRGVVSVRMDYEYGNNLNVYGEFNKFIEDNGGYAINAGMGYKF